MMCPYSYHLTGSVATHGLEKTLYCFPEIMSCHKAILVITRSANFFHDCIYIYILDSTCFLEILALCVSWITYDHFAFTGIFISLPFKLDLLNHGCHTSGTVSRK